MVRGRAMAVTAVTFPYQCAETTRMALGRGMVRPSFAQAFEKRFCSTAFIGLPCPKKTAGVGRVFAASAVVDSGGDVMVLALQLLLDCGTLPRTTRSTERASSPS